MKFEIRIQDQPYAIEVVREDDHFDVLIGGKSYPVSLIFSDASHDVLLVNNTCYDTVLVEKPGGYMVEVMNHFFDVDIQDPRRFRQQQAAGETEGRQEIKARMPGRIVKILVAEGDQLAAGQSILILEAMKMQNEIKNARAGRLVSLPVQSGDTVETGQLLATVETEHQSGTG